MEHRHKSLCPLANEQGLGNGVELRSNQEPSGLERDLGCDLSIKIAQFGAWICLCFVSAACIWFRGEWELHSDMLGEELMYYSDILATVNSNLFLCITNVIA